MANMVTWIEIALKDSFSAGVKGISNGLSGFQSNLGNLSKASQLTNVAGQMSMMALNTQEVQKTFSNFVNTPMKLQMNFEDSMASVKTVINQSNALEGNVTKSFDVVKKAAIDFSKTNAFSTDQYLDSTYQLIGAGLNVEASLAGSEQALKLAKATMGSTGDASSLLADMYNNMGNKSANVNTEMTRLSDVIANTQNLFKITNLNQLNEGLKYGVPLANAYGISIEQLSSVVGQLNNSGLSGSMAGTGFSAMLSQMSKARAKIGFDVVSDQSGNMDLIGTLGNMKSRFQELSDSVGQMKATDIFNEAFGSEAFKAVGNLMTQYDALKVNYGTIQNSIGATENAYKIMSDTTSQKLQIIQQRTEAVSVKLAEASKNTQSFGIGMKGMLLSVSEAFISTPIGEKIGGLALNVAKLGNSSFGFISTSLTMTSQVLMIASLSSHAKDVVGLFGNSMKLLGSSTLAFIGSIPKFLIRTGQLLAAKLGLIPATIAQTSANYALATSTWAWLAPTLLVVGGIALLAGGAYLIIKNWGTVKSFFISLPETVKSAWGGFVDFVSAPFKAIDGFMQKLGLSGKKIVPTISQGIGESKNILRDSLSDNFKKTEKLLPRSDAQEGPFSTLTLSGKKIVQTIAGGVSAENSLHPSLVSKFDTDFIKKDITGSYKNETESKEKLSLRETKETTKEGSRHFTIHMNKPITIQAKNLKELLGFVEELTAFAGITV